MRALTAPQKALLRSSAIDARLLVTFFLDEGTYRFCDDHVNLTDGAYTYIGASAIASNVEVRSGRDLAAEPVTLICDGNRMAQFGVDDPARVLKDMMDYLAQQRRVDWALGLKYPDQEDINLVIPLHAGKINYYRMIDEQVSPDNQEEVASKLEIVIDALAARYNRATHRTRSQDDQQEIAPGDNFYSFTADASISDSLLYWGKDAPYGSGKTIYGGFAGPYNIRRPFV